VKNLKLEHNAHFMLRNYIKMFNVLANANGFNL